MIDSRNTSSKDESLQRVRSVINRVVRDGKVTARSDNSVNDIFPIATNAVQGEALRSWVIKEKAVHTIEIVERLHRSAKDLLDSMGYDNVYCHLGDGYDGLESEAPFDRILLTAAANAPPSPLIEQLAVGGILVMPIGSPYGYQELIRMRKSESGVDRVGLIAVRFVPMTGKIGKRSDS